MSSDKTAECWQRHMIGVAILLDQTTIEIDLCQSTGRR
jgi:hypothetical protein